jgi:hypothetical protein
MTNLPPEWFRRHENRIPIVLTHTDQRNRDDA